MTVRGRMIYLGYCKLALKIAAREVLGPNVTEDEVQQKVEAWQREARQRYDRALEALLGANQRLGAKPAAKKFPPGTQP